MKKKRRSDVMAMPWRESLRRRIKTRLKIVESAKHCKAAKAYNVKEGYFRHTRCWRASRYHSEMEWRAIPGCPVP